tara:strand:+ start:28585 stop:29517 length:933 start_codon:yes stop_codon:yes gene_type:complete
MADTSELERPPLPVISVERVLKRRDKLAESLTQFLGRRLVGPSFHAFVDGLHAGLPAGSNVLRTTLLNSVTDVLKRELSSELLINTCWRIAGNMEKLKDQESAGVWWHQKEFEWVPVRIVEAQTEKKSRGGLHNMFVFQALAGTAASMKFAQGWSLRKTRYLATFKDQKGNGFGFGRSRVNARGEQKGRLLLHDTRQFYGLRCFLLIDPNESKREPVSVEVGHSSATTAFNRDLLSQRDREESPCIKNLGQFECYHCPYGEDNCNLATHPVTYEVGQCDKCGKRAFFDIADIEYENVCITCAYEKRRMYT